MAKLSDDDKHDFIAEITKNLLDDIDKGVDVFVVLSFRHDEERNSMQVAASTVSISPNPIDERVGDAAYELVRDFMDKHSPRWAQ